MLTRKILTVSNADIGKVIGVRGAVVRHIRSESGASVDIDNGTGENANSRLINLSGDPHQVEAAERLIWCAAQRQRELPGSRRCLPAQPST